MEKRLSFQIAPSFENVDMVRKALKGLCQDTYSGAEAESRIGDLCLAATEAMNNAVEHSGAEKVEIEISADESKVVFRMMTKGEKFDPTAGVSMPVLGEGEELQEGGFGLAIIKEIMDLVRYEYVEGRNIMTLDKVIIDKKGEGQYGI